MNTEKLHGLREVSCVVSSVSLDLPLKGLLDRLFIHQPRLTGWPPWVDSRSFHDASAWPYVSNGGWEALIRNARTSWAINEVDFWRVEPTGRFYAARTYEDDTSRTRLGAGCKPGETLDFVMVIVRAAEQIAIVRAFVNAMGVDPSKAVLNFAFRWTGLSRRSLESWAEPLRSLIYTVRAVDKEATSQVSMGLDTPDSALPELVQKATQPLFDLFGAGVGLPVYQELVTRTVERRL
jgi:hypothetical protein